MEQETLQILNNFGTMGLWGIIIYQLFDLIEVLAILGLMGFGLKKVWPAIKEFLG